jgi:hypothetical protein
MSAAMLELESVNRLTRDIRNAAATLTRTEARYLVDAYYSIQDYRKASDNQVKALTKSGEPCSVIHWLYDQMDTLENQIKRALDAWTDAHPVGQWSKSIVGIGPVIAAGLLAHIDITKAPTVGHIWRYAGLDATVDWLGAEKSKQLVASVMGKETKVTLGHIAQIAEATSRKAENLSRLAIDPKTEKITRKSLEGAVAKRPWNADLKVLCWKAGQSFVKVCNNPADIYGKIYQQRKLMEQAQNDAGMYADQAARALATKKIGKDTDAYAAYSQGKLPPAHIQQRAERYATKLFLSHWHHVAYRNEYGTEPPKPYVMSHLGHAHMILPPNS